MVRAQGFAGLENIDMASKKKGSPPPFIAARIAQCRAEMAKRKLPAYVITQHMDTFYMTGFTGEDSAVMVTPRAVHIISDSRFEEVIDVEVPWARKHMRKGQLVDEIGKVCHRLKLDRLAFQPDGLTVETHATLRKLAKPTRLVKAPSITNQMRRCKDAVELEATQKAITVAQDAFKATRRKIRVGQTEQEIAARLEYEMRRRGATGPAFDTIVAVGASASRPHALPGPRQVKKGSAILLDWGAVLNFYRSDLTRMVFVGKIPPRIGEIYKIVLDAQLAAIEAIRPGERVNDIDAVARKLITKAGYGKQFGHGLGHGLGLNTHEPPSLSWRSKERVRPGMVVTVEPGIYVPGVGGVRIEGDVLVTSNGHRVLSNLNKDLRSAVI